MKLKNLIERIKLSDADYKNMKEKAQRFDKMMSTIQVEGIVEYEEVCNAHGHIMTTVPKTMSHTVNIDVEKMFAAGGITFDKNVTKFNVTGF